MQTSSSILVIVPVYNEARHILDTVAALRRHGFEDILVVNDGSTDTTKELLEQNNINALHHLINRGQGAAIQTGFEWAQRGNWEVVVSMDGDGQCDPEDIKVLAAPILEGRADIVVGNRFGGGSRIPLLRRLYNFAGSLITWLLSGIYLTDTQSGMRAYNRRALAGMEIQARGYEWCSDMIRQASSVGLRIVAVPIRVFYTKASLRKGQSFAGGLHTVGKLILRSIMR